MSFAALLVGASSAAPLPRGGPATVVGEASDHLRVRFPDRLEVPFRSVGSLVVVEARVGDRVGSYMVDTGTQSALILNRESFQHLARGAGESSAFSLPEEPDRVLVNDFRWQGLHLRGVEARMRDLSDMKTSMGLPELSGLIGYEVLRRFTVVFDHARSTLELRQGDGEGPPGAATIVPFRLVRHLPVVSADLGGRALRLAVDSGSETGLLQATLMDDLSGQYRHTGTTLLRGLDTDGRQTLAVRFSGLRLARLHYEEMDFVFMALALPPDLGIEGMLGADFLARRRTAIDYAGSRLLIWEH